MVGNPEGKRPLGRPRHKRITLISTLIEYTVPQLRRLIAAFPTWWFGFDSGACYMEFVVDKVALT
jgi:hypothetical protein